MIKPNCRVYKHFFVFCHSYIKQKSSVGWICSSQACGWLIIPSQMLAKLSFIDYLFSATQERSNCEYLFTWNRILSTAWTGNILPSCKAVWKKWSNCSLLCSNKIKILVMVKRLLQKSFSSHAFNLSHTKNQRLLFKSLLVRNLPTVFPGITPKCEYWFWEQSVSGSKWIKILCLLQIYSCSKT